MNEQSLRASVADTGRERRPRVALMGEFSSGKSTLSNLLIGSDPLPVKVTATQIPPVHISLGEGSPVRVDLDGVETPVALSDIAGISPRETRVIRVFARSRTLEACDIIDMPGISDPNMSPEVWGRVVDEADAVIWCTHAVQAWRQSEAAVWEELAPRLAAHSLLLVTRFDKVPAEADRRKLLRRLERETEGLFAGILPVSLTQAMAAVDDSALWRESGAEAVFARLIDVIEGVSAGGGASGAGPRAAPRRVVPVRVVAQTRRPRPRPSGRGGGGSPVELAWRNGE